MAKNPPFYLSFHVGDYLRVTPPIGVATWEYHGIYGSLRLTAWNTPGCRLPTDELWIARHLGCTIEIFKEKVRPVLQLHFKQKRNWWYDVALSTAYDRATNLSEKQSIRASSGKQKIKVDPRHSHTFLPSKKKQQHTKLDSVVEKKKPTRRFLARLKVSEEA